MTDPFVDHLREALAPTHDLDREITGGGMSRVFVATERAFHRRVAVKVLPPELAADVNRARFRREIMLAAQLQHPLIVPLLSAGEHGELLWYTMPFVEGDSLRTVTTARKGLPVREVGKILHDVLDALTYAHARGIIHRDIKPGNVLRHGNHSLVTDFGVAKALSASASAAGSETTAVGMAIGTPAYMAPEQLAADPTADHRVDLYAVGLLAYELLAGDPPFAGASPQATMAAQLTQAPRPIGERCPDLPPALAALIMRLLAKSPSDRPASAREALQALEDALTPQEGTPAVVWARGGGSASGGALPVAAPSNRRPWLIGGAVAATVLAAAVALGIFQERAPQTTAGGEQVASRADSAARSDTTARVSGPLRVTQGAPASPGGGSSGTSGTSGTPAPATTSTAQPGAASGAGAAVAASSGGAAGGAASTRADSASRARARAAAAAASAAARPAPSRARQTRLLDHSGRPRRVAILPFQNGTNRPQLATLLGELRDSLTRAYAAAGYEIATDGDLVQLLATRDANAQRLTAESRGIGALVSGVLAVRANEVIATLVVSDVWRGGAQAVRDEGDLADPNGVFGVVRDAIRAADRVVWLRRDAPRRILVFDVQDATGAGDGPALARAWNDSLRALAARTPGVTPVTDSAARAPVDVMERRMAAERSGAGASVAVSLGRRRDSLLVRVTVRDVTAESNSPTLELRSPLSEPFGVLDGVRQFIADQLAKVTWRPKGLP